MTKRDKIKLVLYIVLAVLAVTFILTNSLKDGEESYEQSKGIVAFVESILDPQDKIPTEKFNYAVRKTAHFTEFALLGFALGGIMNCAYAATGRLHLSATILGGLLVAVADEFLQSFTGRSSSVSDILIDLCGVLFGIAVVVLVERGKRKR